MPSAVAVKISSAFAVEVRAAAEAADRSMTGQIEHWAKLGRAAESTLPATVATALKRSGGNLETLDDPALRQRVADALHRVRRGEHTDTARAYLATVPGPVFEVDPADASRVVQLLANGTRVRGRFKGATFVPEN